MRAGACWLLRLVPRLQPNPSQRGGPGGREAGKPKGAQSKPRAAGVAGLWFTLSLGHHSISTFPVQTTPHPISASHMRRHCQRSRLTHPSTSTCQLSDAPTISRCPGDPPPAFPALARHRPAHNRCMEATNTRQCWFHRSTPAHSIALPFSCGRDRTNRVKDKRARQPSRAPAVPDGSLQARMLPHRPGQHRAGVS